MRAGDLYSETFGAMGNMVSEGIWNQLGRPELDRLSLLVRESVQNSWDARDGDSIDYGVESFSLDAKQKAAFREFFRNTPPEAACVTTASVAEQIVPLSTWLNEPAPRLLLVWDRGTRGLDGPTRADLSESEHEERNFVDFLRNVGQPPTKEQGGGTFGYGKAAFYLASETRTIVVHTRCKHEGKLVVRLTAAALTHHFEFKGRRFTGRHWWGVAQGAGGIAEPFTGDEAVAMATALGLPPFRDNERGTTIGVTAPVFDDETLNGLRSICLRNLWPKLKARGTGRPPISLALRVAGHRIMVPDPSTVPPYDAYWRALSRVRDGSGTAITYSKTNTGYLALEHALMPSNVEATDRTPEHERNPKHVALLRAPELVVKYLEATRSIADDRVGFVGVFMAHRDFDHAFALSEPPTHDDWQPTSVRDTRNRGIVNGALKHIRSHAREFAAPRPTAMTAAEGAPLARLANDFAGLLPGLTATSNKEASEASAGTSEKAKRERTARPQAKLLPDHGIVEIDGAAFMAFSVEVNHALGSTSTILRAEVYPVLGGGTREQEPPNGAGHPSIGWWESPRGTRSESNPVQVGPRQQGIWRLLVPVVDSIAIAAEFTVIAGVTA